MLSTSARLLRLLTLLQARRAWTGPELAARLDVTTRTVRRDVDRLRSLGYVVDTTSGLAGGYRLGASAALPPLMLDDDEAMAVVLGLQTAVAGGVAGAHEVALRALMKVSQVLPARLRRRIDAVRATVTTVDGAAPPVRADVLAAIAEACRDGVRLRFRYQSARQPGEALAREVEPYGVVFVGHRWYLVAWDLARDDFRTFRVDRVDPRRPLTTGARFVRRRLPDGDLASYVVRTVGARAYPHEATIVVHAPASRVRASISPLGAHVTARGDGRCEVHIGAGSIELLAAWIAAFGHDFEVREPPALAAHLVGLAARVTRAIAASGGPPARRPRARTATMTRDGPARR